MSRVCYVLPTNDPTLHHVHLLRGGGLLLVVDKVVVHTAVVNLRPLPLKVDLQRLVARCVGDERC